ncbi:uncharacterized protein BO87DRAFT_229997 [Aspergillus neoniger CBS 115656]|uniref:Uncharacterized protein n=1 Tax=Aspergillus neoniger (strain CBS 115656) TaxID=1448310 RepID=A0A318YYE4_ASPNB|nr:hypothetical protein BO87DRAFT_229997 [Aspergillus neoniger CBS 115656]PYH36740.1 hypothetical protein BO87DRAFT_229997 [Aspergillus neoniger CBS 115656]
MRRCSSGSSPPIILLGSSMGATVKPGWRPKKISLPDPEHPPSRMGGWRLAVSRGNLVKGTVIEIYNLRERREEVFEWEVLLMYH